MFALIAQAQPAQPSLLMQMILPLSFVAIFYFLILRPQQKRAKDHQAMINALKVGDEVVFAGGLVGKVRMLEDGYATVSLNKTTDIKVQRASVMTVLPAGTLDAI